MRNIKELFQGQNTKLSDQQKFISRQVFSDEDPLTIQVANCLKWGYISAFEILMDFHLEDSNGELLIEEDIEARLYALSQMKFVKVNHTRMEPLKSYALKPAGRLALKNYKR